jgi:hypothetical protein
VRFADPEGDARTTDYAVLAPYNVLVGLLGQTRRIIRIHSNPPRGAGRSGLATLDR